jgi:hypothetical protein
MMMQNINNNMNNNKMLYNMMMFYKMNNMNHNMNNNLFMNNNMNNNIFMNNNMNNNMINNMFMNNNMLNNMNNNNISNKNCNINGSIKNDDMAICAAQMDKSKNKKEKKLNQIIKIESVIPIQTPKMDNNEYDVITQICVDAVKQKVEDMAIYCTEKINKKLEKQCFVLIQKKNDQNFDFSFSNVKFEDFLIFNYSDTIFYVKLLKIKKK